MIHYFVGDFGALRQPRNPVDFLENRGWALVGTCWNKPDFREWYIKQSILHMSKIWTTREMNIKMVPQKMQYVYVYIVLLGIASGSLTGPLHS